MRARNLKPSFFKNEDLCECQAFARLLFAGMWGLADRNGNLENRPKLLKAEIFPHDTLDTTSLINELSCHGLIINYEVDGKKFLHIPSWKKHARPHKDEPIVFPEFVKMGKPHENPVEPGELPGEPGENSASCASSFFLNAECGMRNAESPPPEKTGDEVIFVRKKTTGGEPERLADLFCFYQTAKKHSQSIDLATDLASEITSMLAMGVPAAAIETNILKKPPERDTGQRFWQFRKQFFDGVKGIGNVGQPSKRGRPLSP